jgi:putative heme transporter
VVVTVAAVVASQSGTLVGAARRLGQLSPWWVIAAVAAEVAAYLTAAELQRHLLAATGMRISRRFLIALTYAGSAVAAVLPAGGVVATGYTYRRLVRRVGRPITVWVLVTSGVVSTAALAVLGLTGGQLRGDGLVHSTLGRLGAALIATSVIGVLVLLAWASRQRSRLERIDAAFQHVSQWGRRTLRRAGSARSKQAVQFQPALMNPVTMGIVGWTGAFAVGLANWLADGAVLALSFVALRVAVPWPGLLLAYVVSQVAASLPVLGCVGLVEVSLTVALVCIGVKPADAVAATLVYRLVGFWSTLPAGWLAWSSLRRREQPEAMTPPAGDAQPVAA